MNSKIVVGELEHTLSITKPYIVFVNSHVSEQLRRIKPSCATFKFVIQLDSQPADSSSLSYNDILKNPGKSELIVPEFVSDYPAIILFSSGSTGLPKGVMMSNGSLVFLTSYLRLMFAYFIMSELRKRQLKTSDMKKKILKKKKMKNINFRGNRCGRIKISVF